MSWWGSTRAFFYAGTPTILSSLWSVDDEATEALMTAFYKHWQAGKSKAEALQAAQAEVRANPQWASPFYWAGFVLNGDPGVSKISPAAGPTTASATTTPEPVARAGPPTSQSGAQPATTTNAAASAPVSEVQSAGRSPWPVVLPIGALAIVLGVLAMRRWHK